MGKAIIVALLLLFLFFAESISTANFFFKRYRIHYFKDVTSFYLSGKQCKHAVITRVISIFTFTWHRKVVSFHIFIFSSWEIHFYELWLCGIWKGIKSEYGSKSLLLRWVCRVNKAYFTCCLDETQTPGSRPCLLVSCFFTACVERGKCLADLWLLVCGPRAQVNCRHHPFKLHERAAPKPSIYQYFPSRMNF